MLVLLMIVGFISFIVFLTMGIVGKVRKSSTFKKHLIFAASGFIVFFISTIMIPEPQPKVASQDSLVPAVMESPEPSDDPVSTPKETTSPIPEKTEAKPASTPDVEAAANWKDELSQIADISGTKTERADAAEALARTYKPSQDELLEFSGFILQAYSDKTYLTKKDDDEYMLSNIFRAVVLERFMDDAEKLPLDSFAFDFYQNTKYVYRGVDAVDSESVLANEHQMNKAMIKIEASLSSTN
ncbi:hypothetical protein ACTHPH_01595 [Paenibacillus pasadenensis]|uniref:hypothetical protein n=1 Tax=Paenibacillus pasadenensis TaxID=217090 RepID=UPI000693F99E|nr:hypothetical protein [Paenibacillus pasadenensis]